MTHDQFFRGFFAALYLKGTGFIDTCSDQHHYRFKAVADKLNRTYEAESDSDLPVLVPSAFTNRFHELEDAMVSMPTILEIHRYGTAIELTQERAGRILDEIGRRELMLELADAYRTAPCR